MSTGYTKQSSYENGNVISATLFNNDFNKLQDAFAYSSTDVSEQGHTHDGTTGGGGAISKIGDLDFKNKVEIDGSSNTIKMFVELLTVATEVLNVTGTELKPTVATYGLGTVANPFSTANITTVTSTNLTVDTDTLYVDSTNDRVGIGTNNPQKKLHVQDGDIRIESAFPRLYLTDTDHNSDYSIMNSNGAFGIYDDTNATYRMVIASSGNVGIGTPGPANTLTVGSTENSASDQDATVGIKCNANHKGIMLQENSGTEQWSIGVGEGGSLKFYDSAIATPAVTFEDVTGNVGIGTASPAYNLDIEANTAQARIHSTVGNSVLRLDSVDDGESKIYFADNSAAAIGTIEYHHNTNHMSFSTLATTRMLINSSGNVGIGTADPQRELELTGTGNVYARITAPTDDDSAVLELKNTQETWQIRNEDTNDDALEFIDDTATRLTIKKDGKVGIGTDTPDNLLHVESTDLDNPVTLKVKNLAEATDDTTLPSSELKIEADGVTGTLTVEGVGSTDSTLGKVSLNGTAGKPLTFGTGQTEHARFNGGIFLIGHETIGTAQSEQGAALTTTGRGFFTSTATENDAVLNLTRFDIATSNEYLSFDTRTTGTTSQGTAGVIKVYDTAGLNFQASQELFLSSSNSGVILSSGGVHGSEIRLNHHFVPSTDGRVDLGSATNRFNDLNLANNLNLSTDSTVADTQSITFKNDTDREAYIRADYSAAESGNGTGLTIATNPSQGTSVERLKISEGGDITLLAEDGTTSGVFWDASAKQLGVNTTSLVSALNVESADADASLATFGSTTQTDTSRINLNTDTAAASSFIASYGSAHATEAGNMTIQNTEADGDLFLVAGGNEGIRIDTDGNVGIKNNNPTQALDVTGNIAVSGTVDGVDIATLGTNAIVDGDFTTAGIMTTDGSGGYSVDASTYLTAETNDLSTTVTWANVPNANITESSVTQHQAALSVTESQISDFGTYLTTHQDISGKANLSGASFTGNVTTTGTLATGGYTLASTDGTNGQVLVTDGSGNVSFGDVTVDVSGKADLSGADFTGDITTDLTAVIGGLVDYSDILSRSGNTKSTFIVNAGSAGQAVKIFSSNSLYGSSIVTVRDTNVSDDSKLFTLQMQGNKSNVPTTFSSISSTVTDAGNTQAELKLDSETIKLEASDITLTGNLTVEGAFDLTNLPTEIGDEGTGAIHNSSVHAACVYDTAYDTDGGAWRNKTEYHSWYLEGAHATYRSSTKKFPKKVAIDLRGTGLVYIYDLTKTGHPMWKVIRPNNYHTIGNQTYYYSTSNEYGSAFIQAKNGKLFIKGSHSSTSIQKGLIYDFAEDQIVKYVGSGNGASNTIEICNSGKLTHDDILHVDRVIDYGISYSEVTNASTGYVDFNPSVFTNETGAKCGLPKASVYFGCAGAGTGRHTEVFHNETDEPGLLSVDAQPNLKTKAIRVVDGRVFTMLESDDTDTYLVGYRDYGVAPGSQANNGGIFNVSYVHQSHTSSTSQPSNTLVFPTQTKEGYAMDERAKAFISTNSDNSKVSLTMLMDHIFKSGMEDKINDSVYSIIQTDKISGWTTDVQSSTIIFNDKKTGSTAETINDSFSFGSWPYTSGNKAASADVIVPGDQANTNNVQRVNVATGNALSGYTADTGATSNPVVTWDGYTNNNSSGGVCLSFWIKKTSNDTGFDIMTIGDDDGKQTLLNVDNSNGVNLFYKTTGTTYSTAVLSSAANALTNGEWSQVIITGHGPVYTTNNTTNNRYNDRLSLYVNGKLEDTTFSQDIDIFHGTDGTKIYMDSNYTYSLFRFGNYGRLNDEAIVLKIYNEEKQLFDANRDVFLESNDLARLSYNKQTKTLAFSSESEYAEYSGIVKQFKTTTGDLTNNRTIHSFGADTVGGGT